jgi:hypothetical protein
MMPFEEKTIRAKHLHDEGDDFWEKVAFAVDTAGSWEGSFPEPGRGDYLVTIGSVDSDEEQVLVSRRYTGAVDAKNAAEIALSAFAERRDYETDDNGELVEVTNEMGTGIPAWVTLVEKVV